MIRSILKLSYSSLGILMMLWVHIQQQQHNSGIVVNAYHYRPQNNNKKNQILSISSPDMLCLSGTASGPQKCPETPEEVKNYPAVVMDEYGYVSVNLRNIRMTNPTPPSRRRMEEEKPAVVTDDNAPIESESNGEGETTTKTAEDDDDESVQESEEESEEEEQTNDKGPDDVNYAGSSPSKENSTKATKEKKEVKELQLHHHLQVYLVSLEEYVNVVSKSQCCFELETDETRPPWVNVSGENGVDLPKECSLNDPLNARDHKNEDIEYQVTAKFAHDYRIYAPRIGKGQAVSAPIPITKTAGRQDINLEVKLRTDKFGPHMLVISNCAAEVFLSNTHEVSAVGLTALIDDIEITFVSKFGELPLSMMGIIPFYGIITCLYCILATVWWKRSLTPRKARPNNNNYQKLATDADVGGLTTMTGNVPLLGLQRAIRTLVFMEAAFSTVAFTYYLHLNWTPVDINVLYSGTAAALLNWGPWAMFVATSHFLTIFGCQVVVTLATDGTWLIQSHVREDTKKALYSLGAFWILFFCLYGFLSSSIRTSIFLAIFLSWVVFLLFNVRRSLRNLRTLMIGQSSDTVMAVGGALVAKRSLYRRIYFGVATYPIIFLIGFYWNCTTQADSWNWVGYVLGDLYLFVILMHASIIWMPRPMASQEFIKYAPLEVSVAAGNDLELWEEGVNEDWHEEEIELSHGTKVM